MGRGFPSKAPTDCHPGRMPRKSGVQRRGPSWNTSPGRHGPRTYARLKAGHPSGMTIGRRAVEARAPARNHPWIACQPASRIRFSSSRVEPRSGACGALDLENRIRPPLGKRTMVGKGTRRAHLAQITLPPWGKCRERRMKGNPGGASHHSPAAPISARLALWQ